MVWNGWPLGCLQQASLAGDCSRCFQGPELEVALMTFASIAFFFPLRPHTPPLRDTLPSPIQSLPLVMRNHLFLNQHCLFRSSHPSTRQQNSRAPQPCRWPKARNPRRHPPFRSSHGPHSFMSPSVWGHICHERSRAVLLLPADGYWRPKLASQLKPGRSSGGGMGPGCPLLWQQNSQTWLLTCSFPTCCTCQLPCISKVMS